ncbi:ISL3 family transposase [Fusobacterium sp. oral taxon 203]|uniref:ISL3 family transposase n=1 Tax=Fusobacterium sp. oral taxon 203 TaxID=671211 RepID=UPI000B92728F|nr:ISL3 family transposase [Fusobacterium sp. oral taxon 203]
MISLSLSNFIKTILNIQDDNISFPEEEYYQVIQKGDHLIKLFKGFLKSDYCACPHCNSKNIVKNGSRIRKIKYIPIQNYNIELELNVQRHICKECKKTFSPSTNIVSDNSSISNNLKFAIALELQKNISLTSIAKRYNISISSVQKVMNNCYSDFKVNKKHLPRAICIDEFKSVKNIDGAMSFVFADYQSKSIIDIVEDRRLHSLTEYFSRFSLEARNNVKYICMDMYTPYISLVNSIFPNAKIVIDKFHIVNLVNRAFNQTRISIMNSIQDDSLKRKFKLFWKSLLKYYPDLCQVNYYCQSFKRKLSSKDKVDYLLEKSPELEANFNVYQDIIQAIRHNNFKRFESIVKKYLANKEKISKKMIIALRTLKKYMKYIENMFESNITNGVIEGLNNKIKSIKRTAFGYSNFSNFKKRILIQAGIISISA